MSPTDLKERIESLAPGTQAHVTDLTGTEDHYEAEVVSPEFEGKNTIARHRMVYALLKDEMASNEVHALSLKTLTPNEKG